MEVKPHEQIVVKVDGSRRLTLRNRRFVHGLYPGKTSLEDRHLMTSDTLAPTPRPGKTRQITVTPSKRKPTTSPKTTSSVPMQPEHTGYEAPAPISERSSRSLAEIPVNLAVNKVCTGKVRRTVQGTFLFGTRDPKKFIAMKTQQYDQSDKGSST